MIEEDEDTDWTDPLRGQRVHCWILVLAGNRDIQSNIFIEPATAKASPQPGHSL